MLLSINVACKIFFMAHCFFIQILCLTEFLFLSFGQDFPQSNQIGGCLNSSKSWIKWQIISISCMQIDMLKRMGLRHLIEWVLPGIIIFLTLSFLLRVDRTSIKWTLWKVTKKSIKWRGILKRLEIVKRGTIFEREEIVSWKLSKNLIQKKEYEK